MNNLTRGEPSDKETGEHGTNGHEHLTRHIVAPVEERLASEREPVDSATRQRTKHADDGTHARLYPRTTLARDVQLLIEQRGAYLVHGDGRRESCQRQESIEEQRHDVAHGGHGGERLVKHVGQGYEHERGTAVRTNAHGEGGREDHQSGKDSDAGVDNGYLHGRLRQIGLTAEIRGVGAEA